MISTQDSRERNHWTSEYASKNPSLRWSQSAIRLRRTRSPTGIVTFQNGSPGSGILAHFLAGTDILVHHTRKNTAAGVAAGQGLRGSSDIHAFGDSNLYLRRHKEQLLLSSEHRAAPAAPSVALRLVSSDAETTHLEVLAERPDQQRVTRSLQDQVLDLLVPGVVLTRAKLRASLGVKNERLGEALETLERADRLNHTTTGWQRQS